MFHKKAALLSVLSVILLPIFAHAADINLVNNTDSYGTGKVGFLCSDLAGNDGRVKPHSTFTVKQNALDLVCSGTCEAEVFLTKNCSGKTIAKAKLDNKKGVISVTNLDKVHYTISGGGTNITIDQITNGWPKWLDLIF